MKVLNNKDQRVIIYVDFVKDAAPLAISLCQAGYKACSYHGQKLSSHDKMVSIDSWRNGSIKVMVCTTAFGMGIDQPDVETVVRIGCPPTLESMIQEFGRAGRDGRQAKGICMSIYFTYIFVSLYVGILFYCESDLHHAAF